MGKAPLAAIVTYCDKLLRTAEVKDYDRAANGLQVENRGKVTKIAAAVDGSLATVRLAAEAHADLLIVHHGLFWGPSQPWTGKRYELLCVLLENDLAVYSSHLPLDLHPKLGNNALLCAALGLRKLRPFLVSHGQTIGYWAETKMTREELGSRLDRAVGLGAETNPKSEGRSPKEIRKEKSEETVLTKSQSIFPEPKSRVLMIGAGPAVCRRIGVVTGGGGSELEQAARAGLDTFITGEGPHWTYGLAEELGLNVFYGGHYATETFGVKALAAHLSRRFKVPWIFLEHPSGL